MKSTGAIPVPAANIERVAGATALNHKAEKAPLDRALELMPGWDVDIQCISICVAYC